jgi:hypothetical protein
MRAATSRRAGSSSTSCSYVRTTTGTDTDTAATTLPEAPRTGAAMQLMDGSFSSRSRAHPSLRTVASSAMKVSGSVIVFAARWGNSMRDTMSRSSASGRSARSTFATAVECSEARRPIREYIRIRSCDSSLST